MKKDLLHPEIETLSAEEVWHMQQQLWQKQWQYVMQHSKFYQDKYQGRFDREITLAELKQLPFTEKDELRASQERCYPFGDYVACAPEQVIRLHMTSGTTGKPLQLANSQNDLDWIAKIGGRAFYAAGLRPGDRVIHCLNYCKWTGGLTDHMNLEAAGACVIPFGVGNAQNLIDTIEDLSITAISCTPSYPALLEKLLKEQGKTPKDLKLRLGLFGGEAGLDNPEFRENLENKWGFSVRNANYGMSEVMSIFASQSEVTNDLYFHAHDAIYVELIDSEGNSLPFEAGTTGELVCTHLRKECQPLIRYRTRDVLTITGTGTAECGRTTWRFRVSGRTDDMFNVRGINVFPTAVQKGLLSRTDLSSGEFRILLKGEGPYDRIDLKVEVAAGIAPSQWPDVKKTLEQTVQKYAGASASITLLETNALPRTAGKTNLIERSN